MTDETRKQNDQDTNLPRFDADLSLFIEACISLGMTSLEDIAKLVKDYPLSQRILLAAQHNPLNGSRTNAELLEHELKEQGTYNQNLADCLLDNDLLKEIK